MVLLRQNGLVESTFGSAGKILIPFVDVEVMSDNRLIALDTSEFRVYDANGEFVQTVSLIREVEGSPSGRTVASLLHRRLC